MLVANGLDDINIKGSIKRNGSVHTIKLTADLEQTKLDTGIEGSTLVLKEDTTGEGFQAYLSGSIDITALATSDNPLQLQYFPINSKEGLFILKGGEMGIHFHEEYFILNAKGEAFHPAPNEPTKTMTVEMLEDIFTEVLRKTAGYEELEDSDIWDAIRDMWFDVTITATPTIVRNEQNQVNEDMKPDLVLDTTFDFYSLEPNNAQNTVDNTQNNFTYPSNEVNTYHVDEDDVTYDNEDGEEYYFGDEDEDEYV